MPNTVVQMPQLGESVAEGTIGRWLKQPGERVERDEPLVEVQTDKVNAEVPSPAAGVLQRILTPEGATVAVKTDIAIIGDEAVPDEAGTGQPGAGQPEPQAAAPGPAASAEPARPAGGDSAPAADGAQPPAATSARPSQTASPVAQAPVSPEGQQPTAAGPGSAPAGAAFRYDDAAAGGGGPTSSAFAQAGGEGPRPQAPPTPGPAAPSGGSGKRLYTPVVLRLAQEHGIDLDSLTGSGLGGRVTRRDVERAIAARAPAAAAPAPGVPPGAEGAAPPRAAAGREPSAAAAPAAAPPAPAGAAAETIALTPMRRAIADHMRRARAEIPDAWSMVEIDATRLARHRAALQPEWKARAGFELTYLPFFIKAVVAALQAVPELNATWSDDGITLHRRYDLGIAVSLDQGLVVPVLRQADALSVAGLATAVRSLAQKARAGRLTADDLAGATFTVNNPGSLGSVLSQPVVPLGQAGIVTMEAVVKRPVVTADDAIAVRSMMNACLSFDHRILDGAQALRFLHTLKDQLETVEYPLY
jgi:pyruvate/2-oxoglutarate dehydrogenase complex dihydrolipoamide acyltransferase (E2) component